MIARTALAVIDHNTNVKRPQCTGCDSYEIIVITVIHLQAVTKDGQLRYRTECDRGGTKWYSRKVLVAKNTTWMDQIAHDAIQVCFLVYK